MYLAHCYMCMTAVLLQLLVVLTERKMEVEGSRVIL